MILRGCWDEKNASSPSSHPTFLWTSQPNLLTYGIMSQSRHVVNRSIVLASILFLSRNIQNQICFYMFILSAEIHDLTQVSYIQNSIVATIVTYVNTINSSFTSDFYDITIFKIKLNILLSMSASVILG